MTSLFHSTRFPVHRVVMSAASEYFSTLFKIEMKEKYQTEIFLADIDGSTLHDLIEYCYRGEIGLTEDNIDGLLAAAHMLRLTVLEQKSIEYYKNVLNSANCLGVWALAKLYSINELIHSASEIAFNNFMEIVKGDEFKYMKKDLLSEFLGDQKLYVHSEEDVFRALVVWVEFDLTVRQAQIDDLDGFVRVPLLSVSVCNIF